MQLARDGHPGKPILGSDGVSDDRLMRCAFCSPRRYVSLLLLLFLIPGIIMMTAYGLISLELYRGIRLELSSRKSCRGTATNLAISRVRETPP